MAQSETQQQLPITDDTKPTKYHYYPHNQHLYLLPECATQQVCEKFYFFETIDKVTFILRMLRDYLITIS
jgi:hypothetical protein